MTPSRLSVPSRAKQRLRVAASVAALLLASGAGWGCSGSAVEDDEQVAAAAVTIEVANESSAPVYLQQESWLALSKDGAFFAHSKSCAVCECGETSCAVCGMGLPMVIEIPPGQLHTATWGGLEWRYLGDCVQSRAVSAGSQITATVTYADSFQPSEYGGEEIVDPVQHTTEFEHPPPSGIVRIDLPGIR
ncbi:MAG: hypothetical protein JRI23_22030 [Deltaproteobacteria bacterium]|jgi:hypothetical protein|nr:hypothetical protein [Deltaproteobacteria bacterium]MBW2534638.1 hypothetical protein [Deltaproteobacteria bacterium]